MDCCKQKKKKMKPETLNKEMGDFVNIMQERLDMNWVSQKTRKEETKVPTKIKVKLSGKIRCSTVLELRNYTEFCKEYNM